MDSVTNISSSRGAMILNSSFLFNYKAISLNKFRISFPGDCHEIYSRWSLNLSQ